MLRLFFLCIASAIFIRFHTAIFAVLGFVSRNFTWILISVAALYILPLLLKGYSGVRARVSASRSKAEEESNSTYSERGGDEETHTSHEQVKQTEADPWQVLGLINGASTEEIKKAYREQLLKYHPDRVSHLGQEFQEMAHNKAIEIERAYRELCA